MVDLPLNTPFKLNFFIARELYALGVQGTTEYELQKAYDRGVRRWLYDGTSLIPVEPSPEDLEEQATEQREQKEREDAADRALGLTEDDYWSWAAMRKRDRLERK